MNRGLERCGRGFPSIFHLINTLVGGKMQDLLDRLQEAGEQTQHLMVRL